MGAAYRVPTSPPPGSSCGSHVGQFSAVKRSAAVQHSNASQPWSKRTKFWASSKSSSSYRLQHSTTTWSNSNRSVKSKDTARKYTSYSREHKLSLVPLSPLPSNKDEDKCLTSALLSVTSSKLAKLSSVTPNDVTSAVSSRSPFKLSNLPSSLVKKIPALTESELRNRLIQKKNNKELLDRANNITSSKLVKEPCDDRATLCPFDLLGTCNDENCSMSHPGNTDKVTPVSSSSIIDKCFDSCSNKENKVVEALAREQPKSQSKGRDVVVEVFNDRKRSCTEEIVTPFDDSKRPRLEEDPMQGKSEGQGGQVLDTMQAKELLPSLQTTEDGMTDDVTLNNTQTQGNAGSDGGEVVGDDDDDDSDSSDSDDSDDDTSSDSDSSSDDENDDEKSDTLAETPLSPSLDENDSNENCDEAVAATPLSSSLETRCTATASTTTPPQSADHVQATVVVQDC